VYYDLRVVTQPASEPVTIDQLRQHCRIDSTNDDALLAVYITAARSIAEQYCNRAFITQTLQWTMANASTPPGGWPFVPSGPIFVLPLWFNWADVGGCWLELPRAPTQSIVSVSTGMWGATDTALVADQDFTTDVEMQPGRIRMTNQATNAQDHVVVQYVAGYGDTAASVPPQICLGIMWIAAFLYENRGDTEAAMPKGAERILSPFRLVTFG
jgi:hypothetical protein